MKSITLGSLFDGSGGFPLAGALNGIEPVWASEVEPYPIAVTRSRFPRMKHLGDVSKINGAKIEPVDVITFGSPCQDMSVAGKRAGLKHENKGDDKTTRSGLFYEAIRIIREMREATDGRYPTFAVWENVPGAFSSNKGEDFRCVLEEFVRICDEKLSVSRPANGRWNPAGEIMGDGFSVAWRTLDAQYWGVPQRRKRIYLVADFAGGRAGEILFEREDLRGHPAACGAPGKGAAADAAGSTGGSHGARYLNCVYALQGNGIDRADTAGCNGRGWREDVCYTLNTIDRPAICFKAGQGAKARSIGASEKVTHTLQAKANGGQSLNCTPSVLTSGKPPRKYIIRRLTPLECCRLQGFPDGWGDLPEKENMTDEEFAFWQAVRNTYARINSKATKSYTSSALLKWYNKLHTDSAEYKMWGNGIALPCAKFIMEGIAELCKED